MNCLLLLIILFFCNGNTCGGNCCGGNFCNGNICDGGRGRESHGRNNCMEQNKCETIHREGQCTVGNRSAVNNDCCNRREDESRTQFPYLEIEHRTCGCEEKTNS